MIRNPAEFQTVLPDEKLIAEELERSRKKLEGRRLASTSDMRSPLTVV